jgi:hypothetical protein
MTRQQLRRAALMAAVLTGAAGSLMAQETPTEFAARRSPGWSVTPGVTIGPLWDSNVALTSATAEETNSVQADTLLIVQPTMQVGFVSPRTEFTGGYLGYIRRYKDLDQLNGIDHRSFVSFKRLATRRLTYSFSNEHAQLPTTDQLLLNGVPFGRIGTRMNLLTGGVSARLSKVTGLSVRYENTWVEFDRNNTVATGGWLNGVESELSRQVNEQLGVGAEYGVRFADLDEGARQLTFNELGGAVHAKHGPHTMLTFAGGLAHLSDRTLGLSHTGPYLRAELTHDTGKATVGASFENTFAPSFGVGASNRNKEVRGFVRMPLDRNRMYIQGSAGWRRTEPFDDVTVLNLDTILLRSTLGYATSRWLRLEGYYAFSRQDTRIAGGGINRHVAGTQVVVSQPMRIH